VIDRIPLVAGLAVLAIGVVIGSLLIAGGIRDRNRNDVITVTGSAKQRIASDYVIWNASLTSAGPTAADAERRLARWSNRVRAFFRNQGVKPGELTVLPISTLAPGGVDEEGNEVTEYTLTREFEIRSSRVAAIAALAERSSELLRSDIPLAGATPEYVYTKLSALRPQLLTEAIRDAKRRADVIVDASETDLGKIRGVDVGVFQVTAPNSTEVSDYGEYDTSTRRKDVTAVVNVTYALD
jgi:uncharacterized protein